MTRPLALLVLGALVATALPTAAMTEAQSHDPRDLTWIVPRVLAVGGGGLTTDDLAWLASQGFGAVADFRGEHDDGEANARAAGLDYLDLPETSAASIQEPDLERFVAWAEQEAAHGKPMYGHCSNGWHRAPAFAMAYLMATDHLGFDEAAKRVKDARPGALVRAPGPLLAYQAKLAGRDALQVDVTPGALDFPAGSTQTLNLRVTEKGAPVAGALVHVWTEEPGLDATLTTDAAGAASVTYRVPAGLSMAHLFARASAPGHLDGAANPEVAIQGGGPAILRGGAPWALVGLGAIALAGIGAWARTRRGRAGS